MTTTQAATSAAPVRSRLRDNHDFIKLWAGESVSLIGTQITQFALPLVAVLSLGASAFQVGVLNACRYAPVVVVSLFAGVWLDRRRRRPILLSCSLTNAVLIGLVPLAYGLGFLSLPLLCGICLCVGVITVVFDVGALSFVPTLVDKDNLADANGRIQTSTQIAGIAGPGIAGLLVGILTAPVTLTVDAVSYLCSAAGLAGIRTQEPEPDPRDATLTVRQSITEGLHTVYGSPLLRGLLTQSATFNFFQNGLITVFVVYTIRDLGFTATKLGLVMAAISVGGVLGATFANRVRLALGLGRAMLISTVAAAICPLVLLIPRDASVGSLVIFSAAQAVYGFNLLVFNVNTVTLRQLITPRRLLGRMNASYRMVLFGTGPFGAVLGGLLADAVGLRTAIVVTALVLTTPVLWIFFSPVFRLSTMPDRVDDAPPAGGGPTGTSPAEQTPVSPAPAPATPAPTAPSSEGTPTR